MVRALSVLAGLDHGIAQPAFSGGTSLSKGWQLISRFSEDIDFKIAMPATATRRQRSDYRKAVLAALQEAGFILSAAPLVGDNSSFFRADFLYQSLYPTPPEVAAFPCVDPADRFAEMLEQLGRDPLWEAEYEEFVR